MNTVAISKSVDAFPADFVDRMCEWIASGKSMKSFIAFAAMLYDNPPSVGHVYLAMRKNPDWYAAYHAAKMARADAYVEELVELADESTNDVYIEYNKDGEPVAKIDGKSINRARLMIDTRKWVAAKHNAQAYGDKLDVTSDGGSVQIGTLDSKGQAQMIAKLLDVAAKRMIEDRLLKRVPVEARQYEPVTIDQIAADDVPGTA